MLDPNLLRTEPDAVAEKLARRGFKLDVDNCALWKSVVSSAG